MAFRLLYLLYVLLLNVLAIVVTSSARSTGLVQLTDLRDELDSPVYSWMISEDEQERLTDLLGHDFRDVGVAGTYVTAPPQVCTHCGKETEFIDWAYTALKRGVHSREFIVESLKAGRTPKGVHHDVYCSRCGHLTHFRDHEGNEGGALHIAHATPYDRATKTFGNYVIKREAESDQAGEVQPSTTTLEKKTEDASWCQRCAPGNWLLKREEDLVKKAENAAWCQRCAPGNWLIKREEDLVKKAENAAWCQRCAPGNWLIKRDAVVGDADTAEN